MGHWQGAVPRQCYKKWKVEAIPVDDSVEAMIRGARVTSDRISS